MIYVLYTIHVFLCLFLILVVLLQQGKGADLSVFGGGSTQAAFGARGAATLLHKLTVAFFVGFIFTTMTIAIMQRNQAERTVMGEEAAVEETAPAEPDGETPAAPAPAPSDEAEATGEEEAGTSPEAAETPPAPPQEEDTP